MRLCRAVPRRFFWPRNHRIGSLLLIPSRCIIQPKCTECLAAASGIEYLYSNTMIQLSSGCENAPPPSTRPASPRPLAGPAAPALVPVPRGSSARPKTGCQTVPKQANSCQIAPRVPGSWPLATDSAAFPGPRHTRHLTYIHTAAVLVKYSRILKYDSLYATPGPGDRDAAALRRARQTPQPKGKSRQEYWRQENEDTSHFPVFNIR